MADLILELLDLVAVEFDDFFAVLADDVIMVGMLGVVWVVKFVIFAEIHFADEAAFGQQGQGAIDGGAGNRFVPPARPFQKLLGGKMLAGAEGRFDDGLALSGQTEVFLREKIHERPFSTSVTCSYHARSIRSGGRLSQRP